MDVHEIKQRFKIIGNSLLLNRAIDIARQVAPTDISVLITGESGAGKEAFSKVIHDLSPRKHNKIIAVNCGAIPEGTIDSELFGHVKGSFTNAVDDRKGYFEEVNGGTIFLDEVAELPLSSQARLLRILESGEYLRVGSSKVQKTDVRIIAATNVNVFEAVQRGKFREDLYYRLNTVPLQIPSLRQRKEDIYLLFRKFVSDFSEKYRSPTIQLTPDARELLENYSWPGNVRQLRNIAEQIAVLEKERVVEGHTLRNYLPAEQSQLPMLSRGNSGGNDFSERDLLYKVLFDMRKDITDLKKLVVEIIQQPESISHVLQSNEHLVTKLYSDVESISEYSTETEPLKMPINTGQITNQQSGGTYHPIKLVEEAETSYNLPEVEIDTIKNALKKYKGKRKLAAAELGISERTLYRKIKELNI